MNIMSEEEKIQDKKYWNAINLIQGFGPKRFKKLYSHFDSMESAWKSDTEELRKAGLEEKIIGTFLIERQKISPDEEMEKIEKEEVRILTIKDDKYPKLLKEIYDPPAMLYTKGEFKETDEFSLAVVGTRKMSSYGQQVVLQITRDLARAGITIVSGMATGIDSLSHKASLEGGGRTIAVIGSGIDKESIYPSLNRKLAREIISNGVLISEYPIGTLPLRGHFPSRNRIISGLALGVLVIEAPESSGALITAQAALDQNRQVFAIPGNIYAQNSLGSNNLIKMGAKLVTSANDVLEELNLTLATNYAETKEIIADTREEEELLKYLSREPIHIDKLVELTPFNINSINSTLAIMEMKGKVRNLGGMNYVIAR